MLVYVITNRRQRPDLSAEDLAAAVAQCGADMIQIRDKDLCARSRLAMARRAVSACAGARVFVNGRPDIAKAAGAVGVHLPADGLSVAAVRGQWGRALEAGVSIHSVDEAERAEIDGADFVVFGPVFETASKRSYGPPAGLEALARTVAVSGIPVLAVGGITPERVRAVRAAGAAGVAVISWVIESNNMRDAVECLREEAA